MGTRGAGRVVAGVLVGALLMYLVGCGGGDSSGSVSAESLQARLPPASLEPGYRVQRTFDWADPVNLVGEGLALPAATRPADAVKVFRDANLQGATGEHLAQGTSPLDESVITIGVAKFPSEAEATKVRDWMNGKDLQEPCYGACIFSPTPFAIPGVPTAKAVEQRPNQLALKSDPTLDSRFRVVFTDGPYLHWIAVDGPHSSAPRVAAGAAAYYKGLTKASG